MKLTCRTTHPISPEQAWTIARSPAVMRRVAAPVVRFHPISPPEFPDWWSDGSYRFTISMFGIVPLGTYRTDMTVESGTAAPYRLIDDGRFGLVRTWRHEIRLEPTGAGTTRWTDEITIDAGRLTRIVWLVTWLIFRFRSTRLRTILRAQS